MDSRLEVRCLAEDLARWKSAVPVGVPFAAWVRGALNAAAAVGPVPRLESHAVFDGVVTDMHSGEVVQVLPMPRGSAPGRGLPLKQSFQPDFKKGGK